MHELGLEPKWSELRARVRACLHYCPGQILSESCLMTFKGTKANKVTFLDFSQILMVKDALGILPRR